MRITYRSQAFQPKTRRPAGFHTGPAQRCVMLAPRANGGPVKEPSPGLGVWARAGELARRTPEARNRYVDFLRAVSIGAVVLGHWLIAAPQMLGDNLLLGHMLDISPWTRWLTWGFQVMPVFFIVGGYSNLASWTAANERGQGYAEWLNARLRRLVAPVVPLLITWAVIAVVARRAGVPPLTIKVGSQAALVPVWFLAVYVLVACLAPATVVLWRRWGIASFWALAAAAVVVDVAWFSGLRFLGWTNYLFVWLAVHQLGYLWREGRLAGAARALPWAIAGGVALVAMVEWGPYPLAMVGVPGEEISNTLPPKLPMLALAALQAGLLLSLEAPLRRWLSRAVPWTATVLVNGMIMTIYLWHLTAMALTIGALYLAGGFGLRLDPGSGAWWLARPAWLALLVVALLPLALVFGRYERPRDRAGAAVPPAWRLVAGAALVCAGLAFAALSGVGADTVLGLRVWVVLCPLVGAALIR